MCDDVGLNYLNVSETPHLNIKARLITLTTNAGMSWQAGVRRDNREDAEIVATIKLVLNELLVQYKSVLSRGVK